jgi:NlpC/P60 family putative phage cell wall peptidase
LLDAAQRHFSPVALNAYRPGDVLVFRFRDHLPAKHLGIATTHTHMAHAHGGACVTEVPIGAHWGKRLAGAFAFPGVID